MNARPRRTALYLPASNARALVKARTLPADVVILDLEDAVGPGAKADARAAACAALADGGFGSREVVVRVNGLDTPWGAADCAALGPLAPAAVLVPKIRAAADLSDFAARLGAAVPLWAMVETARSLFALDSIAGHPRVAALVLGTNDLVAEMGARPGPDRAPLWGALGLAVAAARAHGRTILDGVFNDLDDPDGLLAEARQGLAFGFDGKTVIHPGQIEAVRAVFTPDHAAVAAARQVVAAFADPAVADRGALRLDGRMVERLHLMAAHRTLAAAGEA